MSTWFTDVIHWYHWVRRKTATPNKKHQKGFWSCFCPSLPQPTRFGCTYKSDGSPKECWSLTNFCRTYIYVSSIVTGHNPAKIRCSASFLQFTLHFYGPLLGVRDVGQTYKICRIMSCGDAQNTYNVWLPCGKGALST